MHFYQNKYIGANSGFLLEHQIGEDSQEKGFNTIDFREQHIFFEHRRALQGKPLASPWIPQAMNEQEDHYLSIFLREDYLIALAQMQQDDSTKTMNAQFPKNNQSEVSQPIHSYSQTENSKTLLYERLEPTGNSPPQLKDSQAKLCDDYGKNLPGYIFKSSIRLLLKRNSRNKLEKVCKKWGVNPQYFTQHYSRLWQSITGPNSLISLFRSQSSDEMEATMKEMFEYLIGKVLRGRYLLSALKEGKMKSLSSYIEVKNKYLLYFSKLIHNY